MKLLVNFNVRRESSGGANAFLSSLSFELATRGFNFTTNIEDKPNIAFLNALTNNLRLFDVRKISAHGIPILHRKTGFCVSGSDEMRCPTNNGPIGDLLQIGFDSHIKISVFQSTYSKNLFQGNGSCSPATVIRNGVNTSIFKSTIAREGAMKKPVKTFVITSWSTDKSKGFAEYKKIDKIIKNITGVKGIYVGNLPQGFVFENIKSMPPMDHQALSDLYNRVDFMLALSKHETCSNALIEGLACGLPVIYSASGANEEIARSCGIAYSGNFHSDLAILRKRYDDLQFEASRLNFSIKNVADQYEMLFYKFGK